MGSLLKFFSLTYAVTWACFITAAAISHGTASIVPALAVVRLLLLLLGTFAPSLVALWLTARADGSAGTHALLRRLFAWRVGAQWYVFAVSYMAAIKLAVALVHRVITGSWPRFGNGEEIGWRGYALPRLAARSQGLHFYE